MTTENTAGTENQNDVSATAPESGTAPESQGSENTLLTDSNPAEPSHGDDKSVVDPEKKAENNEDTEPAVPEKYDFKDAGEISIDDAVKNEFSEVARDLGLSQEKAQGVLDRMAPAIQKAQQAQLAALSGQWEQQSRIDSEFGGDKFMENMAVAKKALDTFGSPELKEILNKAGLGNHPEIIRAFYRAGQAISGDRIISGRGASDGKPSGDPLGDMADRMYK